MYHLGNQYTLILWLGLNITVTKYPLSFYLRINTFVVNVPCSQHIIYQPVRMACSKNTGPAMVSPFLWIGNYSHQHPNMLVSAKFSKDKTSSLALKSSYYPNSLPHTKVFKSYLFYDLKIFMVRQYNDTDDIGIDERQTLCYLCVALKDSRLSVTQGCRGVYTPQTETGNQ